MDAHDVLLEHGRRNVDSKDLFETDNETSARIRKLTDGISASLHVLANEPSLGLYRMQEHVSRTVPELVETKRTMKKITQRIQGACHDVEYALNTVQKMHNITSLASLHAQAVKAIEHQQVINAKRAQQVHIATGVGPTSSRNEDTRPHSPGLNDLPGVFSDRLANSPQSTSPPPELASPDPEVSVGFTESEADAAAASANSSTPSDSQKKKKKKKKKPQDIVTKSF